VSLSIVFGTACCNNDVRRGSLYPSVANYDPAISSTNRTLNYYSGTPKLEIIRNQNPDFGLLDKTTGVYQIKLDTTKYTYA
jgi:hypothetical protein